MKQHIKRVAKHRVSLFAVVGVVNTILDIVLLNILRVTTHTTTDQKARLILLNIVSASTVAVFSFFMNRRYVFKSKNTRSHMLAPFLVVTLSSIFILQSAVIGLALHGFDPIARTLMNAAQDLHIPILKNATFNFYEANIAKLCATAASMVWNYTLYKKFIFKHP